MQLTPARPVLRYYGGKWRIAPWIIQHFPPHRVYVEPFGGAASVLMQKRRSYAEVYNDLDGEVVNVFRVLRDPRQSVELERLLRLTPFARDEQEAAYEPSHDPVEQARRTIIKSFMGFSSSGIFSRTGFRNNTSRSGTTPAHDWASYPDSIRLFTERLRGVVIENRPAIDVIREHDREDTLHYVDPPYVISARSSPSHEYRYEMTDDDHRELAAVLRSVKGMVVVSGYPSDLYNEFFGDWRQIRRKSWADGAGERTECLWLNPRAAEHLQATLW